MWTVKRKPWLTASLTDTGIVVVVVWVGGIDDLLTKALGIGVFAQG